MGARNEEWTEKLRGVTFKLDYFPLQELRGLFVALDSNYARVSYRLQETRGSTHENIMGLGPRIGYRFDVGQHLYLGPGCYQFGARDVVISGKRFEQGRFSIVPTVHIGWRI